MGEILSSLDVLFNFPTIVPCVAFIVCASVLFISMITGGLHIDTDTHVGVDSVDNMLVSAGLSKIPLFVGLTLTFFPMTIITLVVDSIALSYLKSFLDVFGLIGNIAYYIVSAVALIFIFYISLHVAKFLSQPIEKAFEMTKYTVDFLGREGIVNSKTIDNTYGEIRVRTEHGESLLDARTEDGLVLHMNDHIVICGFEKDTKNYIVKLAKKD
jgi:hypothetical protein